MTRGDNETVTEFEANDIRHIVSVVGNDDEQGTTFILDGVSEKQFCLEPAKEVKQLVKMNKQVASGATHNIQIETLIGGVQVNSPNASQQVNIVINREVREAIDKLGAAVAISELDNHDKDEIKHSLERIAQLAAQTPTEKSKRSILEKLELVERMVKLGTTLSPIAIPLIKIVRSHFGN
jgi:hypothetical protein